jgi:hypothetical protein
MNQISSYRLWLQKLLVLPPLSSSFGNVIPLDLQDRHEHCLKLAAYQRALLPLQCAIQLMSCASHSSKGIKAML